MSTTLTVAVLESGARVIKSLAPGEGSERSRAQRAAGRVGVPPHHFHAAVHELQQIDLIESEPSTGSIALTPAGARVRQALAHGRWGDYAAAVLGHPDVLAQLEPLLTDIRRTDMGLTVEQTKAVKRSPLVAAILKWSAPSDGPAGHLSVPEVLLERLSLSDERMEPPAWVRRAAQVGARAERYSLLFLRQATSPGLVLHVAAESDRYGYDIEDRSRHTPVFIEVKGSTASAVVFHLSAHERRVATLEGTAYEIHFWGGIRIDRTSSDDYRSLRRAGFPVVIRDPEALLSAGALDAVPNSWLVSRNQ